MKMRWLIISILSVLVIACAVRGTEPASGATGAQMNGKEFVNSYPVQERSFSDLWKWRQERKKKNIPDRDSYSFKAATNDPGFLRDNREQNTFTWVGHATALVQVNGLNILTDPQFSRRASPVQWAGPERIMPPGLGIDDLPAIDIVIVSHDHYDSLDSNSIKKLARRDGGSDTLFAVPLGMGKWMRSKGVMNVVELDWWQTRAHGNARITAVPAQHWSKRYPFVRNRTLWAGWVIRVEGFSFYFSGDTGYSPHFRDIGERLGPMDLSAISIGAYEPRWFMKGSHINPEEAVMAHRDVRSARSIGIHWGTFILTDEPLDEPPRRLRESMVNSGVPEEEFRVLLHGETVIID